MLTYAAEAEIADLIRARTSFIYAQQIFPCPVSHETAKAALEKHPEGAKASKSESEPTDELLYPFNSILASVGKNKNDDYFTRAELYKSRATAVNKPLNYKHKEDDIVGHITAVAVVDEKFNTIADDTPFSELPRKFHLKTEAVFYTVWEHRALQERATEILEEVKAGDLYVSMECVFDDFDYVLFENGKEVVIARNEDTAFMTKYLRAYGGDGKFEGKQIARALKNIVFKGKGLVKKPANAESVIFTSACITTSDNNTTENDMADSPIKVELSDERIREVEQKHQTVVASLNEKVAERDAKIQTLEAAIATAKADHETAVATLNQTITDLTEKSERLNTELAAIAAEKLVAQRTAAFMDAGAPAEEAKVLAEQFKNLEDRTFASIVDLTKSKYAAAAALAAAASKEDEEDAEAADKGKDKKDKMKEKEEKSAAEETEAELETETSTASEIPNHNPTEDAVNTRMTAIAEMLFPGRNKKETV